MNPLASAAAWEKKLPTKAGCLRRVLSDGDWHGQRELSEACGHRFGAVLWSTHRTEAPVHYERRADLSDPSIVFYRLTHDTARCAACSQKPLGSGLTIQRLKERVVELEQENAALRARFAAGWGA